MMYSRKTDKKLNNSGFTLVEMVVSVAIMVIVAGAIGVLLSGSLSQYDYNEGTVGLQIESQQYAQRLGNSIQVTGYGVFVEPATDKDGNPSADCDNIYLYTIDPANSGAVLCDVYFASPTDSTYNDGGTTKNLYTIKHYSTTMDKAQYDSGVNGWSGAAAAKNTAEPYAGGIASVHYTVFDQNAVKMESSAFTMDRPASSGAATEAMVLKPKKVTVEVRFMNKNRKLTLDDATFFFRNDSVRATKNTP